MLQSVLIAQVITTPKNSICLVIVQDSETKEIIRNCSIKIDKHVNGALKSYGVIQGAAGHLLLPYPKGLIRLTVSADNYDTVIKDSIIIPFGNETDFTPRAIGGDETPQILNDQVIVVTILLDKANGREKVVKLKQFISDTYFYEKPEISPVPIGGYKGIIDKIDLTELFDSTNEDIIKTMFWFLTDIDKYGSVVSSKLVNNKETKVTNLLREAINKTKFIPAKILGKNVCSRVYLPFKLDLKRPKLK